MNTLILTGNLTREPESRFTAKGTAVANFGIAVNKKWRDDGGTLREETMFLDCVAFGKTAESLCEHFGKGGAVLLEGELRQETWDDKATGAKKSKHSMLVDRWEFHGDSKKGTAGTASVPAQRQAAASAAVPEEEDDIPF